MASHKENPLLNIGLNVVLPSILLMKLGDWFPLSPLVVLIISLLPPLCYGIWDIWKRRKYNFFSILGIASILLTGGLGLLQFSGLWLAVKEAAVPLVIAVVIAGTVWIKKPLFGTMLREILSFSLLEEKLVVNKKQEKFAALLDKATYALAGTLVFSSVMNFFIARTVVVSDAGSPAFNQELAQMNLVSYPIIVIPSFIMIAVIMYMVMSKITVYTGMHMEELLDERKK